MTDTGSAARPTRRSVLGAAAALPFITLMPSLLKESRARAAAEAGYRFFSVHQAAVVAAAAARLVPGPADDPREIGHPGATEAGVVYYVDTLLSALDEDPPKVFAGGPYSNRHQSGPDFMARFLQLDEAQRTAWRIRTEQLQQAYTHAVYSLDGAAGGDFASVPHYRQDHILSIQDDVRDLIFANTVEAMYAVPEYGGNRGLVGWQDIHWPGDVQPVGYTAQEVQRDDGLDPVDPTGIVALVLDHLPLAAAEMHRRGWRFGR